MKTSITGSASGDCLDDRLDDPRAPVPLVSLPVVPPVPRPCSHASKLRPHFFADDFCRHVSDPRFFFFLCRWIAPINYHHRGHKLNLRRMIRSFQDPSSNSQILAPSSSPNTPRSFFGAHLSQLSVAVAFIIFSIGIPFISTVSAAVYLSRQLRLFLLQSGGGAKDEQQHRRAEDVLLRISKMPLVAQQAAQAALCTVFQRSWAAAGSCAQLRKIQSSQIQSSEIQSSQN